MYGTVRMCGLRLHGLRALIWLIFGVLWLLRLLRNLAGAIAVILNWLMLKLADRASVVIDMAQDNVAGEGGDDTPAPEVRVVTSERVFVGDPASTP